MALRSIKNWLFPSLCAKLFWLPPCEHTEMTSLWLVRQMGMLMDAGIQLDAKVPSLITSREKVITEDGKQNWLFAVLTWWWFNQLHSFSSCTHSCHSWGVPKWGAAQSEGKDRDCSHGFTNERKKGNRIEHTPWSLKDCNWRPGPGTLNPFQLRQLGSFGEGKFNKSCCVWWQVCSGREGGGKKKITLQWRREKELIFGRRQQHFSRVWALFPRAWKN